MRVELSSAPPGHQRCGPATFNRGFVAALPAAGEEILRPRSDDGVVTSDVDGNHTTEGGGARLAVGLFAPPLLASVAVWAVAGGVIGKLADHRVERDIHGHSDS